MKWNEIIRHLFQYKEESSAHTIPGDKVTKDWASTISHPFMQFEKFSELGSMSLVFVNLFTLQILY